MRVCIISVASFVTLLCCRMSSLSRAVSMVWFRHLLLIVLRCRQRNLGVGAAPYSDLQQSGGMPQARSGATSPRKVSQPSIIIITVSGGGTQTRRLLRTDN